jgi:predicted DCC family thiol-disulfide oxidoreductase YuxK
MSPLPELGQPPHSPPRGWILYDGACGFCRTWVPKWEKTLARRGYALAPLQSPWVAERTKLSSDELLADLLLLRPDGSLAHGTEVYRDAMRRIWWAWPLWLASVLPLGRQLFDWSYRSFADHRYRISRACRLPGASEESCDREPAGSRPRADARK